MGWQWDKGEQGGYHPVWDGAGIGWGGNGTGNGAEIEWGGG